jgi:PBP1b-binding outer membrane lipoprotein LpoB
MKKEALVISALLVLLLWLSACVGSNGSAPKETISTVVPTTIVPIETTVQVMNATPVTTVLTTMITTAQSQPSVILTVNSAQKQPKIYTMTPASGFIFLVLNITVKNNNIEEGYEFTDTSIKISTDTGRIVGLASTPRVRGGLDNPILTPTTIEQNDKRTGQIVFAVPMDSGKYTLHLLDNKGMEVFSEPITV